MGKERVDKELVGKNWNGMCGKGVACGERRTEDGEVRDGVKE